MAQKFEVMNLFGVPQVEISFSLKQEIIRNHPLKKGIKWHLQALLTAPNPSFGGQELS